jgi:hypothetical protein
LNKLLLNPSSWNLDHQELQNPSFRESYYRKKERKKDKQVIPWGKVPHIS